MEVEYKIVILSRGRAARGTFYDLGLFVHSHDDDDSHFSLYLLTRRGVVIKQMRFTKIMTTVIIVE